MSANHLTTEQIERVHRFALAPEEFLDVYTHLDECDSCRDRVEVTERVSTQVADLSARILFAALDGPEHLTNERIAAFVDGASSPMDQQIVKEHLQICDACHTKVREVDALRSLLVTELEEAIEPLPDLASASGAALQDTSGPVMRYENDVRLAAAPRLSQALTRQIRELVTRGIATPTKSLRGLRTLLNRATALTPVAAMRSGGRDPHSTGSQPTPTFAANTVVRSPSPTLRWQAVPGAREYTVTLSRQVSEDDRALVWKQAVGEQTEVALPESIRLEADQLYLWLVEAALPGQVVKSLPVWFSVLSPQALETLEPLERAHADSALILAGLYETYGLYEEARQQLDRLESLNPDSELLHTLQQRLERERNPEPTCS